jgi:hypothetical protein
MMAYCLVPMHWVKTLRSGLLTYPRILGTHLEIGQIKSVMLKVIFGSLTGRPKNLAKTVGSIS